MSISTQPGDQGEEGGEWGWGMTKRCLHGGMGTPHPAPGGSEAAPWRDRALGPKARGVSVPGEGTATYTQPATAPLAPSPPLFERVQSQGWACREAVHTANLHQTVARAQGRHIYYRAHGRHMYYRAQGRHIYYSQLLRTLRMSPTLARAQGWKLLWLGLG